MSRRVTPLTWTCALSPGRRTGQAWTAGPTESVRARGPPALRRRRPRWARRVLGPSPSESRFKQGRGAPSRHSQSQHEAPAIPNLNRAGDRDGHRDRHAGSNGNRARPGPGLQSESEGPGRAGPLTKKVTYILLGLQVARSRRKRPWLTRTRIRNHRIRSERSATQKLVALE